METFIKVYFELEEGENLRLGLLAAGCGVCGVEWCSSRQNDGRKPLKSVYPILRFTFSFKVSTTSNRFTDVNHKNSDLWFM